MNFLKRLELQGFKSFASKTVLEFPSRVTAIVGPNGSGKSNIVDGLRWVLGERGAKELRGATLENLIFAGTAKKSAVSLAKVSLHFNNSEKTLPFEAEEMALERKIDRSGNSTFLINDVEIKMKDLVPVLARAKLGNKGLTMIGQGQSDLFVKIEPKERRLMIEEILGLKEFRLKKEQAERRLESSRINMDKVKAMLEELSPHLKFLRRQKNRFDKRVEIQNSLIDLENKYFGFHAQKILIALKDLEKPIFEIKKRIEEKEKEINILESELKNNKEDFSNSEKIKKVRAEISSLLNNRFLLEKELAKIEVRIELGASNNKETFSTKELSVFLEKIRDEIKIILGFSDFEKVKIKLRELLERSEKFFKKNDNPSNNFENENLKLKEDFNLIEEKAKLLRGEEEALTSEQYALNKAFREKVGILENKKNELRNLEEKRQNLSFEKERLNLRLEELEKQWQSFGRLISEFKELNENGNLVVEMIVDSLDTERKMLKLRAELSAIGEIDDTLVKEAAESEERFEFLSHELEDLEKATIDLKNLIKELEIRIHEEFKQAFRSINEEFNKYFRLMFGGGKASLKIKKRETKIFDSEIVQQENDKNNEELSEKNTDQELESGVEIELNLPKKKISDLEMLSGGEKSLVSLAALFALISVSPPPFLVLDEIDAALDDENARRFAELVKEFSKQTQFIIVTHNRATMEAADILYGITLGEDGVSRVLSLKLE